MHADTTFVRRWLLDEARSLARQQDEIRARREAVRAIMRLVAELDPPVKRPTDEAAT